MATGIARRRDVEVYVFIDSDSQVTPDAVKHHHGVLRRPESRRGGRAYRRRQRGAQHADPDAGDAVLHRIPDLQERRGAVRFGHCAVPGCFSAYRRDAVAPVLDAWLDQTFLGQPSTFGDDRSLTNFVLHRWRVLYAPDAQAYTNVPEHLKQFLRQQLRWKKSWLREIPRAARAVAHKNPIMVMMFALSVILPLLAPQVVLRAMVVQPHFISSCRSGTSAGWPPSR